MSKPRSQKGRARSPEPRTLRGRAGRTLQLEALETRAVLTNAYPFGAMPEDLGEYMLGDVAVNVVLMESDPSMAPYDNLPSGRNSPAQNWVPTGNGIESIARAKANVDAALQWWKDTLAQMFPNAPADILKFHINYEHANTPVHTGYEPIDRWSDDFYIFDANNPSNPGGWLYDFLDQVGFGTTGSFSTDIRAYNDSTRQQANADWAFTIFVVNNANDVDGDFAQGGSFDKAFAFAGGRFMVVPASRPTASFAHEAGHEFWAMDEYRQIDPNTGDPVPGTQDYLRRRGYYNAQNLNAADYVQVNPQFVQANSIMSNGASMNASYANHTLDPYTMAHVGWQDGDNDGIFDVLDVPFSLSGSGSYNPTTGQYTFTGASRVNTLPNRNSSSLQNDITINQIEILEASIDGGPWQTVKSFPARSYEVHDISVNIPIPAGLHTIRLRTADTRTGVKSNELFGKTDAPAYSNGSVSGVVFSDSNGNGAFESSELAMAGVGLTVTDTNNTQINLHHAIEPDAATEDQVLNNIEPGGVLSVISGSPGIKDVTARRSTIAPLADKVFNATFTTTDTQGNPVITKLETWSSTRKLRVNFNSNSSTVSLTAIGSNAAGSTFGRLEAYDAGNNLIGRFTTKALALGQSQIMTVSRPQGDIHHVIAYGHAGSAVILDSLAWGPGSSTTSNSFGAYSLDGYPDGNYRVHVTPPAGYFASTPPGGYANITVSGGKTVVGSVNFGIAPLGLHRFHNSANPFNVTNDPGNNISAVDAIYVINYLNAHMGAEGEISNYDAPAVVGYIDVNNDGKCAPNDALEVINYINAHLQGGGGGGGEGEQASATFLAIGSPPDGGGGEGETPAQSTRSAKLAADRAFASHENAPPLRAASPKAIVASGAGFLLEFTAAQGRFERGASERSAPSLPHSPIATAVHRRGTAITARRPAAEVLSPLASEVETALDDIAADVADGLSAARLLDLG